VLDCARRRALFRWALSFLFLAGASYASTRAGATASRVYVTLIACPSPGTVSLAWTDVMRNTEGSVSMSPGLEQGTFVTEISLAKGSYNFNAYGSRSICAMSAHVLVLGDRHDRHITLMAVRPVGGKIGLPVLGHMYQLGGALPYPVRGVTASCKGDAGDVQTFEADVQGEAYYFDTINAWRCTLSISLWGRPPATLALPRVVDLRILRRKEGFVERDISASELANAAGL